MRLDARWFILVEGVEEWYPIFGGTRWIPAYCSKEAAQHAWHTEEMFRIYREKYPNAKVRYKRVGMPWHKLW